MPRVSPYQGNFGSGEFSPLVQGRTDADRYKSGLYRCFNFIPTLQGGATARPGTKYIAKAKNSSFTRMIPFKFSQTDAFLLEFGNGYIRFFNNRGPVYSSGTTPYELTTTYTTADLPDIKFTQSLDTLYLVHPNYPPRKLVRISTNLWNILDIVFTDGPYANDVFPGINGPSITAVASGGQTKLTVDTFTVTNIQADGGTGWCKVTVSANVSYLRSGDVMSLSGVGGTTEANGSWNIIPGPTVNQFILQNSTFVHAYTSGGIATDGSYLRRYFSAGQPFRYILTGGSASVWNIATISFVNYGVGAIYVLLANPPAPPGSLTELYRWRTPAYGAFVKNTTLDSINSYPTCVTFHENRLYFGGAGGALQRIDGSNVGDYENFAPSQFANGSTTDNTTITSSQAVSFSFLSNESNIVQWLTSDEKGMVTGTSGGPWIIRPSALNEAITPTNITAKKITGFGSSSQAAVVAGKSSIFIESSKRRIREISYFYDVDGFRAVDLSELAEHLPAKGVSTNLTFQNTPQNVVWSGRADGTLLGITYDRTLDTLRTGWHQHNLGGVSDISGTPPVVESLATIPSPDGTCDDVWMSVKRYINGTTVRTIEYLTKVFESFNVQEDAFFVDCGATFDNPITYTGLTTGSVTTITSTAHGLATGDGVRFRNVTGLNLNGVSQINGFYFQVTVVDANTFTIALNSTSLSTYVANGLGVYRKMVHTISGLTWLEGATVQVCGDGADVGDLVVTSGAITLPGIGAGTVQIGFGYSSELQQLRIDGGAADGTSFGKLRRINELAFMVDRTASFEYGTNFDQMFPIDIRKPFDPMDQATPLYSGIIDQLNPPSDYDTENRIAIRQTRPLPITLLAIMPQMITQDKG